MDLSALMIDAANLNAGELEQRKADLLKRVATQRANANSSSLQDALVELGVCSYHLALVPRRLVDKVGA